MNADDLLPILNALNYQNLFIMVGVFFLSFLTLIELIRLVIVIKRSVKGRMDRV